MLNAVIDFDITTTVGAQINSQFRYILSSARITSQANNPSQGDHFFKLDSSEGSVSGGTRELFLAFASL
jgi:hypothetical protein